jgi:hypothetical protein
MRARSSSNWATSPCRPRATTPDHGSDRRPGPPGPGRALSIDRQNPVPLLGDGRVVSRMSATDRLPALNSSIRPPAASSEAGNPPM